MAITQTVEIPASREINLKVPPEVPVGRTILTFTPDHAATSSSASVEGATSSKLRLTKKELEEILQNSETPHTDALFEIFSKIDGNIDPDEIRMERLSKHLR